MVPSSVNHLKAKVEKLQKENSSLKTSMRETYLLHRENVALRDRCTSLEKWVHHLTTPVPEGTLTLEV